MIVISPHLDDAVLSLGQTIANLDTVRILTLLSGEPPAHLLTSYDQATGFGSSREAVTARRKENATAAAVLGFKMRSGPFLDQQYGDPAPIEDMASWVERQIEQEQPTAVFAPVGIAHEDHERVADAARIAWMLTGVGALYLYEELPYRVQFPEIAVRRVQDIGHCTLDGTYKPGPLWLKQAAVECYRSQVTEDMRRMVYVPERVWRFDP